MKYAQMIMGLLVGTALGSTTVAMQSQGGMRGGMDNESVKKIVRQTISEEPQLIMESVQKYQEGLRKKSQESASESLKDSKVRAAVYDTKNVGIYGPKNGKRVVVQFFDYNCGACKAQHKAISQLTAKDKNVTILFREYPIFGPVSDTNSHLGLAVARLAPEKYFAFYEKMMDFKGHTEEKDTLAIIEGLGLDADAVKAEAAKPEIDAILESNRVLGDKLHIQGTPTLVIGDEVIPHALGPDELAAKLGK